MFNRFIFALAGSVLIGAVASSGWAGQANMAISVTGTVSYNSGTTRTVTISLVNNGPATFPGINFFTMPLPPASVTISNIRQPDVTVPNIGVFPNNGNNAFQVNFGDFAPGATAVITFDETSTAGTPAHYTDRATLRHDSVAATDPDPSNDVSSLEGIVKTNADVQVSFSSIQGTTAGQPRTIEITVTNAGPQAAGTVVLTKNAAAGTNFASFVQLNGPSFAPSGNPINTYTIASLAGGATALFRFIENIPSTGGGQLTDTATVTSDATDPSAINNTAQVTFNVTGTPVVTVGAVSINEGDNGTTFATFTAMLSLKPSITSTVNYVTVEGTAKEAIDYVKSGGTLLFAPNEQTQTFTVPIIGNTVIEPNKQFTILLSAPQGVNIGANNSVGTIVNDDFGGVFEFSAGNFSQSESAGTATITVKRTGGLASNTTVDYTTSDGTALDGVDYTFVSGTLTFAGGEATKTFSIPLLNKYGAQPGATVNLTLSNPTNTATLGTQSNATLTILAAPAFTNPLLVEVLVNTQFSFGLTASGESPITFSANSAMLPSGVSFQLGFFTGIPTVVGSFAVPITATNVAGADNKILVINVTPVPTVPGASKTTLDSDGDGFPDEIESAAGSSQFDFKSTPINNAPAQVLGISSVKLAISLNFTRTGKDTITLKGSVPLPAGFRQSGKLVYFDIGGVVRRFALDDRGTSKIDGDSVKFKLGASSFSQAGAFTLTLKGASAAALLADEGLTAGGSGPKGVPVVVMLNTNLYKITQAQLYVSNGSKGKSRNP